MNAKPNKNAFTLIEMLAVIVILSILLTLAIGVTDYVRTEAKIKQTRTTMDLVMTAIQVYYDEENDWPSLYNSGSSAWEHIEGPDSEELMQALTENPKTKDMVSKLSKDSWEGLTHPLNDSWGNEVFYYRQGGVGSTPLLISAGKDGVINSTDEDHADNEDNIRSDS